MSVVIPVYRQGECLGRAISSALTQDYENLEVIVVDDGSDDDSVAVALRHSSLDPRVRVLRRHRNGGLGRARNTGIGAANGDYVTFLDSDDYLLPGSISERVAALRRDDARGAVGAYGDWLHVTDDTDVPHEPRSPRSNLPVVDAASYSGANPFVVSSPLVRRDAVIEHGGFAVDVPALEDWVLWVRLLASGHRFVPVDHLVCVYRQRPSSMLRSSGVVLPELGGEINAWWLEQEGCHLADGSRMSDWLHGRSPLRHQRRSWLAASGENGSTVRRSGQDGPRVDRSVEEACTPRGGALHQGAESVLAERAGSDEAERIRDIAQFSGRRPSGSSFEWALVATDVEGALEAAALARHLDDEGITACIGIAGPDALPAIWPLMGAGVPIVRIDSDACEGARFIVWSRDDDLGTRLARGHGKSRVIFRPTGVDLFNVRRRRGQTRFRSGDRVILRSPIEAAEHGDRPHAVVESGARHGYSGRRSSATCSVLASSDREDYPALDGWVSTALRHAVASDRTAKLIGPRSMKQRLRWIGVGPVELELLTGRVVLDISDDLSLVQALGGRPIVFAPSLDDDAWSRAWVSGLELARSELELATRLSGGSERPGPVVDVFREGAEDQGRHWATRFLSAL